MDKIAREIVLLDSSGRPTKELKSGQTFSVRVRPIPVYNVKNHKFSDNNK
jgi:hypothetical protein